MLCSYIPTDSTFVLEITNKATFDGLESLAIGFATGWIQSSGNSGGAAFGEQWRGTPSILLACAPVIPDIWATDAFDLQRMKQSPRHRQAACRSVVQLRSPASQQGHLPIDDFNKHA